MLVTVLTWMVGAAFEVLPCPYFDERACLLPLCPELENSADLFIVNCARGSQLDRSVALAAMLFVFDVVPDLASTVP